MPERTFNVTIVFDRKEGSRFGGVQAQVTTLLLDAKTTGDLVSHFQSKDGVISIAFPDGKTTRYINTANILYMDVQEILVNEGGDNEGK